MELKPPELVAQERGNFSEKATISGKNLRFCGWI